MEPGGHVRRLSLVVGTMIRAQFVPDAERDPYDVLGVAPDMPIADIKKVWSEPNKL